MQLDLKKAFKVESFEKENGQIIITYTIPELPEILDSMNVSGKASVDFSKFEPAEGVTMNVDTGQTFSFTDEIFDQSGTLTTEQKINLEGNVDLGKNREILYELSLGIEDIKYKFDVDFNSIFDDGPTVLVRDAFVKMKGF